MEHLKELKEISTDEMLERYKNSQKAFLGVVGVLKECQQELIKALTIDTNKVNLQSRDIAACLLQVKLMPSLMYVFQLLSEKNTHNAIFSQCEKMFAKKNEDYGNAFVDFGAVGILIRINDKLNRAITLQLAKDKQKINDENLIDTLLDAVNYTIMADILLSE